VNEAAAAPSAMARLATLIRVVSEVMGQMVAPSKIGLVVCRRVTDYENSWKRRVQRRHLSNRSLYWSGQGLCGVDGLRLGVCAGHDEKSAAGKRQ